MQKRTKQHHNKDKKINKNYKSSHKGKHQEQGKIVPIDTAHHTGTPE